MAQNILIRQANIFAELQECVVRGARELFDAYGVEVVHEPGGALDTHPRTVMAVIGYAASGLRGALLLVMSQHVAATLKPDLLRSNGTRREDFLRDVLGEFSNMLIGRVKNQLVKRGVEPLLATPTTVLGDDLALPVPKSGLSAWHRFTSKPGDIFVRLDATLEPEFHLGVDMPEAGSPIQEGEMLMFEDGEAAS